MKNAEVEIKDYNELIAIGIVGAMLALAPLEIKDTFENALLLRSNALSSAANALSIALVSAYSSIKIARIRAEVEKTRQSVPYQESWLDALSWAIMILILLVTAFIVGVLASVAFLGSYFQ